MFDNKILKWSGILLTMFGFVDAAAAVVGLLGYWAMEVDPEPVGMLGLNSQQMVLAMAILLGLSAIEVTCGFRGIVGSKNPVSGAKCLYWGIIEAMQYAVCQAMYIVLDYQLSYIIVASVPILCGLYIYGALRDRKELKTAKNTRKGE